MDSRELTRVLLAEGNEVPVHTSGFSMGPTIRGGETVVVRAAAETEIRFGDVVVFDRDHAWVCHRVVGVRRGPAGRVFVTKGDPAPGADAPVPFAAVLGRVVRARRPEGDVRMEGPRARLVNLLLAAGSLAAGWWRRRVPAARTRSIEVLTGRRRTDGRAARLVRRLHGRVNGKRAGSD